MEEKDYKIYPNYVELYLDSKIYNITVIKKALFNHSEDSFYILKHKINGIILVKIHFKTKNIDREKFIEEIYEDLLNESLRYDIMLETKNVRELILGRALYSTCINTDVKKEEEDEEKENYNIKDIAINWFDREKKC